MKSKLSLPFPTHTQIKSNLTKIKNMVCVRYMLDTIGVEPSQYVCPVATHAQLASRNNIGDRDT